MRIWRFCWIMQRRNMFILPVWIQSYRNELIFLNNKIICELNRCELGYVWWIVDLSVWEELVKNRVCCMIHMIHQLIHCRSLEMYLIVLHIICRMMNLWMWKLEWFIINSEEHLYGYLLICRKLSVYTLLQFTSFYSLLLCYSCVIVCLSLELVSLNSFYGVILG